MSYCTKDDLIPARLSEKTALELTAESGSEINYTTIDKAIAAADAEIDSYIGKQYRVPVVEPSVRLIDLSITVALYKLYSTRGTEIGMPEVIRTNYEDAIAFLKDVRDAKETLGIEPEPPSPSQGNPEFHANSRQFTRDKLSGY
jgi:phage gp36-like protein